MLIYHLLWVEVTRYPMFISLVARERFNLHADRTYHFRASLMEPAAGGRIDWRWNLSFQDDFLLLNIRVSW